MTRSFGAGLCSYPSYLLRSSLSSNNSVFFWCWTLQLSMAESGDYPLYSCRNCRNPLAFHSDLLSKTFKAKSGQAYMFSHVMNIVLGQKEDKKMITGMYTVAGIFCSNCGRELGWKYVRAFDPSQRFKEGNFIVEKLKLLKEY